MSTKQDNTILYSDEEEEYSKSSDDEFDCYDDFEYEAKGKRCPKSNAGIKPCLKKVKGGLRGLSNAMKSH